MPARVKRLSRTESVALTRARLLDAAEEVFAEHGFGRTTLEQIAERAGYTRGAVYANFTSKDDLFLAVLDRWL
ncbi:MAG: TetR/AcrR family transcriptional regulator, partial [Actinomycetota bacterium]|nr:TetR/AcrR family transcriptional regulator [Actinomycetota bacterium]